MARVPFWREPTYHDFNRLAETMELRSELEGEVTDSLAHQVRRLFELDQAQEQDIERLETILKVLAQMLIEAGVLDQQQLSGRVTAALEAQQQRAKQQRENPTVSCARCQRAVGRKDTYVTGVGSVCRSCYHVLET